MAVPRKGSVVIVEIELPRLLLLVPHQRRPVKVAYPGGGGPGREHRIALRDQQRLFALVPMNPIDGCSPHYAQHHPGRIPRKRPVQRFRRRTESHVIHPVAKDDRRIAHMPRMVIMPVAVGRSEQRRGPILRSVAAPTAVFTKHLPTIQIARTGMVDRIAAGIFGILSDRRSHRKTTTGKDIPNRPSRSHRADKRAESPPAQPAADAPTPRQETGANDPAPA